MNRKDHDALKLENQLCFPLYAASRQVIKLYRPYLDVLDLTYTQYIAMMVLWEEGEVSAKELGKRLYLDSGTLTPLLKSLETKGFVTRSRSKDDERLLMICITEKGRGLKQQAADVPGKVAGCVRLEQEEAMLLYALLYKVLDEPSD